MRRERRNSNHSGGNGIVTTQGSQEGDGLDAAWASLCDALKAMPAATIQRAGAGKTPLDRAEGYRYLTRLARIAFDGFWPMENPFLEHAWFQLRNSKRRDGSGASHR